MNLKTQSLISRLITFYLLLTDRKSKYQLRWFYKNSKNIKPPKRYFKQCIVSTKEVNNHKIWIIEPKDSSFDRSILFLHGGGFAKNFQKYHWRFIEQLSLAVNAKIIAPDYPLLPSSTYKLTHQFILDCYQYLNSVLNIKQLTVIGDSAGATIALNTAQYLKSNGLDQPKEFILLSPWLDLTLANPQIDTVNGVDPILDLQVLQKLGHAFSDDLSSNNALVSPIYNDLRRIAPITVYIGSNDIMLADCRKLKNLSASLPTVFNYREFKGMFHNWMYFNFPEGKHARTMIYDQIKNKPSDIELVMQENNFGW